MSLFITIIAAILFCLGLIFFTGGAVGIIRMPDFYTRLHPAGKLDTMGQLMCLSAMALYVAGHFTLLDLLTAAKIMLILVLVFFTSPTATHAIVDSGVRAGLDPWTKEKVTDTDDLGA